MADNATSATVQGTNSTTSAEQSFMYLMARLKPYSPIIKESEHAYKTTGFAMLVSVRVKKYEGADKGNTLVKLDLPGATETIEVKVNQSDVADVNNLNKIVTEQARPIPVKFTITSYTANHVVNGKKVANAGRYCAINICTQEAYNEFKELVNKVNAELIANYANDVDFDAM